MNDADFAVWVYGSVARGDADELSDTDVLLISDASDHPVPAVQAVPEASVSHYTWGQITSLAEVGSLFLHHLRLEGRVVGGTAAGRVRSVELVSSIGPYRLYRRDIAGFRQVLHDIACAQTSGSTPEYELAVLGTLARHSSIVAAYLLGEPCFSRYGAFDVVCERFGFPPSAPARLRRLYQFRMALEARSDAVPTAGWSDVSRAYELVASLIDNLEECAHAYERKMPRIDC